MRRRYNLVADGIRVTESSLTEGKTVTVPYELVFFGDTFEMWTSSRRALGAAIAMAAISLVTLTVKSDPLAWLFWAVGATLAASYYVASRHDQVGFTDGSTRIAFYRDRPSAERLDEFLTEIRRRARERIRARLLPLRESGDAVVDRNRARTLRDKGVVSDEECADFERELGGHPPLGGDDPLRN